MLTYYLMRHTKFLLLRLCINVILTFFRLICWFHYKEICCYHYCYYNKSILLFSTPFSTCFYNSDQLRPPYFLLKMNFNKKEIRTLKCYPYVTKIFSIFNFVVPPRHSTWKVLLFPERQSRTFFSTDRKIN